MAIVKYRFFSGSYKTKRASHRLRGELMAAALRELGHDASASGGLPDMDSGTVAIFLKLSQPEHIVQAKSQGAVTVYDLCDNKFSEKPEYVPCCQAADIITVNSDAMAESVRVHTGRHSVVIPDPYERPELTPVFNPDRTIRLLWFGGGSSLKFFPMIEVWQRLEREIKDYEFTMITAKADRVKHKQLERQNRGTYSGINFNRLRFHEWNWDLQGELLANTDIVLMPVTVEHYRTETKSANRLIDSVMSGKFVITSPLDSYVEFQPYTWQQDYIEGIKWARKNPADVLSRISHGQDYTRSRYQARILAERWINLAQQFRNHSNVS
jgi:hypothetical protein